jgi:hypothetical protein
MAQKTGFGCTLTFGTTTSYAPKKRSINGPGLSREALNSSHLATTGGYETYIPNDLVEGGEVSMEVFWDALDTYPPISAAAETITITNNDSGAATEAFSGFITGFEKSSELGALQMATVTIKVAGAVTFTA